MNKKQHTNFRCKGGNDLQEIDIKVAWSGHVSTGTGRATSSLKPMRSAHPIAASCHGRRKEKVKSVRLRSRKNLVVIARRCMYVVVCMYV